MCSRCYEGPELKEILQLRRNVDSLQQQTRSGSFLGRTWQGQGRLSPRLAHELAKKSGSGKLKALCSVRSPWRRCQGKVLHVTRSLCSMVPTGSFAETIGFKAGLLRLLQRFDPRGLVALPELEVGLATPSTRTFIVALSAPKGSTAFLRVWAGSRLRGVAFQSLLAGQL